MSDTSSPFYIHGIRTLLRWRGLPFLIACIVVLAPFNVWRSLKAHEDEGIQRLLEMQAMVVRNSLAEHIGDRLMVLDQFAAYWAHADRAGAEEWDGAASLLLKRYQEIYLLACFRAGQLQHSVARMGMERDVLLQGLLQDQRQQLTLNQVHSMKRISAWLAAEMPAMLVVTIPLPPLEMPAMSTVNIINLTHLLEQIRNIALPASFGIGISMNGDVLYRSGNSGSEHSVEVAWESPIGPWLIKIWPGRESVDEFHSWATSMPLVFGPLLAMLLGYLAFIAQRSRALAEDLGQSNRRLHAILNSTHEAMFTVDMERKILSCNQAAEEMFGCSRVEMVGRSTRQFYMSEEEYQAFGERLFPALQRSGYYRDEITLRRANGKLFPAEATVSLLQSEGQPTGMLAVICDITKHRRADYDPLTGLPNRALFQERLKQALIQSRRYSNSLAVLFLDLDEFKPINDRLGHAVGDELLRQVAQRINRCVREEDTISRLGGDEFTVLLNKVARPEDTALVAQNINSAMRRSFHVANEEFAITVSIGISFFPDDGEEADELVHRADVAMYAAKRAGGGGYRFYSDSTDSLPGV